MRLRTIFRWGGTGRWRPIGGDDGRGDGEKAKEPSPPVDSVAEHPTSVEVEPPTERGSTDDVSDLLEDLGDGHEPSSSSSKPLKKMRRRRIIHGLSDSMMTQLDPFKMPDGKSVPYGYVYDCMMVLGWLDIVEYKRVPGYPSDLWGRLSQKERNRRWEENQKKMEDRDKSKSTCAPSNALGDRSEHVAEPSMPVENCSYEPHRSNMRALVEDKLPEIQKKLGFDLFANVAMLTKHEISKSPWAQKDFEIWTPNGRNFSTRRPGTSPESRNAVPLLRKQSVKGRKFT